MKIITLPVPNSDEERKLTLIFIYTFFLCRKRLYTKALNALTKPSEAPQGSVKIKNQVFILIQLSEMHGAGRDNLLL